MGRGCGSGGAGGGADRARAPPPLARPSHHRRSLPLHLQPSPRQRGGQPTASRAAGRKSR
jgi:hypothetical protein